MGWEDDRRELLMLAWFTAGRLSRNDDAGWWPVFAHSVAALYAIGFALQPIARWLGGRFAAWERRVVRNLDEAGS